MKKHIVTVKGRGGRIFAREEVIAEDERAAIREFLVSERDDWIDDENYHITCGDSSASTFGDERHQMAGTMGWGGSEELQAAGEGSVGAAHLFDYLSDAQKEELRVREMAKGWDDDSDCKVDPLQDRRESRRPFNTLGHDHYGSALPPVTEAMQRCPHANMNDTYWVSDVDGSNKQKYAMCRDCGWVDPSGMGSTCRAVQSGVHHWEPQLNRHYLDECIHCGKTRVTNAHETIGSADLLKAARKLADTFIKANKPKTVKDQLNELRGKPGQLRETIVQDAYQQAVQQAPVGSKLVSVRERFEPDGQIGGSPTTVLEFDFESDECEEGQAYRVSHMVDSRMMDS